MQQDVERTVRSLSSQGNKSQNLNKVAKCIEDNLLDEYTWKLLAVHIRHLFRSVKVTSEPKAWNHLLGAYLSNDRSETISQTHYDIAAFCCRRPDVIQGNYKLDELICSEACQMLLFIIQGSDPWRMRQLYDAYDHMTFDNSTFYADLVLHHLGKLICNMDNAPSSLIDSLPDGIRSGWKAQKVAEENIFRSAFPTIDYEIDNWYSFRAPPRHEFVTLLNSDAINLASALFRNGILSSFKFSSSECFPKKNQKQLAFALAKEFAEVKHR